MKVDFNLDQYKFVIGASWNVVYSLQDDSFFCIMTDPYRSNPQCVEATNFPAWKTKLTNDAVQNCHVGGPWYKAMSIRL